MSPLQPRRGVIVKPRAEALGNVSGKTPSPVGTAHNHRNCVHKYAPVKAVTTAVVLQAATLNQREFTYSPMSSVLLMSRIMNTSTNGSTAPLITWLRMETCTSGRFGVRITPAPATISNVYSQ